MSSKTGKEGTWQIWISICSGYKYMWKVLLIMVFVVILSPELLAAGISLDVSVSSNQVVLGESIQLNITFHGATDTTPPQLPQIKDFSIRYVGPSTQWTIINNQVSSAVTFMYSLIPLKTGKFTIGPFSIKYKGETFQLKAIEIEVLKSNQKSSGRVKTPDTSPGIDQAKLADMIFLVIRTKKEKIYLNELIPFTITLYIRDDLGVGDIQYPKLEVPGFFVNAFDKPRQYAKELKGFLYNVIEFSSSLFAMKTGKLILGPAKLNCSLLIKKKKSRRSRTLFDDFFGGDPFEDFFDMGFGVEKYPLELESNKVELDVLPLPEEGKPMDFSGAIGDFQMKLSAEPRKLKVGDPITLRIVIEGNGNFSSVKMPNLSGLNGFKTYEPHIEQKENKKIFEQILMPQNTDIKEIPEITFSFFNPEEHTYRTIKKSAIPIEVHKPEKEEEIKIVELPKNITSIETLPKEEFGKDIRYIKEKIGKLERKNRFFFQSNTFIIGQIVPLFLVIVFLYLYKRRERLRTDVKYARRVYAYRNANKLLSASRRFIDSEDVSKFYETQFKVIREYLGDKFGVPSGGITFATASSILSDKKLDEEVLQKLKLCFEECDFYRYAMLGANKKKMEESLQRTKEVIKYIEKKLR